MSLSAPCPSPALSSLRAERGAAARGPAVRGPAAQVAQTCDVDEQAALLQGWNQRYEQLSAGSFEGRVTSLHLGPIQAWREFSSQALHQTGALRAGQLAIGLPSSIPGNTMFCNRSCSEGHAIVFSGDGPFEFVSPGGLEIIDFVVDQGSLDPYLTACEREQLQAQLAQPHLRPVSAHERWRLPILLSDMQQCLADTTPEALPPQQLDEMAGDVLAAIAAVLRDGVGSEADEQLSYQRRAHIVSMARERVVATGADGSLTVEDLCQALAVSRRALQYSFQEVLGISPQSYLRAVRLNGARRAIKQGSSVSDAALAWGFWHFGRFAQEYKALFAELPSHTCKRYR
ncbi:helix-turn-helix domain-containing protein [Comamonas sp. B-9]|uniref:helix-turn-helix domain-containing protein n=1 Tax=Comamonas sp. B-9 TaxID=1055192 RepID=UPI000395AD31|nr:helix-turn-helix domain-containing protein [Comamonas sp. B-9]